MKHTITCILVLTMSLKLSCQTTDVSHIEGIWENEGYGRLVEIKKKKTFMYDICKINCSKPEVIPNKILVNLFDFTKTSDSTLVVQNGVSKYYFNKIETLPKLCSTKTKNKKDPLYNFDVLWQTFEENFCYFKERNIDWDAQKVKYRSKINESTIPFELFLVFDEMLSDFKDGHSNMVVPDILAKDYENYRIEKQNIRKKVILDSLGQDFELYPIDVGNIKLLNIKSYVKDVKTYNFGVLNYGLINDDVAIVQVNGMAQFANYNIPSDISEKKAKKLYQKNADKSENYSKDNTDGVAYIMDKIISEIKDTKACIIDLRFNSGGYDEVALEILKRFATKDTIAVYKKARNGNGFTQKTPIAIKPTENAYAGKVFILTSHFTFSAGEGFVQCAIAARPGAIIIGSNTNGIFSDMLGKKLPNGWEYNLSNEIYESPDGASYEAIGIEPHYKIGYSKKSYWFYRKIYENKKDEAIEKALDLLKR